MASSAKAIVKPELLVWARTSIGLSLDDAARKIDIGTERLAAWEIGEQGPTVSQLRKVASVYKRPLAVFYLPKVPKKFDAMKDFRRLPEEFNADHSPALQSLIRKTQYRRQVAVELSSQIEEKSKKFSEQASLSDSSDKLAGKIRALLNIVLDSQFTWKDDYEALRNWIIATENLGILVFQSSDVPITEMRGFSISEERFPVILLNAKDTPRGRTFTLVHELTHLFLRNGGLCNLREHEEVSSEEQKIEAYCNQVAGAVLVPSNALSQEQLVVEKKKNSEFTDADFDNLAKRYKVSQEVILRRLLSIERVSMSFYRKMRARFLKGYEKIKDEERKGGPPYYKIPIRSGQIIAPDEVLVELQKKEDDLYKWAKQRRQMFLPLDEDIQIAAGEILEQFPRLVDTRKERSQADPFVIAVAMCHKRTLITGEKSSRTPEKPRIPNVCEHFGVSYIRIVQLIRQENWRF